MVDNIVLNPGFGGDVIASEEVNGVQHQLVKVEYGNADSASLVTAGNPLPVRIVETGSIPTTLFEHLKSGSILEITSSVSATSGSPDYYYYAPASSEVVRISQLNMQMQVSSSFGAEFYGDMTSSLVNGLELQVMSGSDSSWTQVQNLTAHPIQKNIDWGHFCYNIQFVTTLNTGSEFALAKWKFEDAGAPIRLDGSNNEALVLIVRDNLSSLTSHQLSVQGILETSLT